MRRNLLTPVLAGLLLLGGITASIGQITLISYTNQWSYLVTNSLPPGGWTNVNYPAAAGWPVGAGPLAFPINEPVPAGVPPVRTALDTNFNGTIVTSFYFRATSANLPPNPTDYVFTVKTVVDDGAVFYVNGRRVQNLRVSTGPVTHNTLATASPPDADRVVTTFTIPATNFVQGANVIAVSVHQDAATSGDVLFAMELEADNRPPTIVAQPQSQTVQVGRSYLFEVEATGAATLFYRWFTNGVLVPSSNTNRLIRTTTLAMDGTQFYVVVSNALGQVQSQTATLRVVPDTFGPVATLALLSRSNWIELRFDEPILQSSTNNVTNFVVHVLGTGQRLPITNVLFSPLTQRSNVSLRLIDVVGPPTNYVVCVYNISDNLTNVSGGPFRTLSTCVPIAFTNVVTLVDFNEIWRYNDKQWLVGNTDPTNGPGGVDWKHINYPDDPSRNLLWLDGTAPLRDDVQPPFQVCTDTNQGTALGRTPITAYMRKRLTVSSNFPPNATLMIRHQFDDAAVVYLNGRELYRTAGLTGTPSYGTYSLVAAEGNCVTTNLTAPATNVIRGQNIIAVELHQVDEIAQPHHDNYFDMQLNVVWPLTPIIPDLAITQTNTPAPSIRLSWSTNAPGWQLQSAPAISGPWTPVTPPPPAPYTNYVTPLSGGSQRFYRLVNP